MKKLLGIGIAFVGGLLAGRLFMEVTASADGGVPETVIENGDVNGNGDRDIADASYLLNWLFLGGDPPCDNTVGLVPQAELDACQAELQLVRAELAECRGNTDTVEIDWVVIGSPGNAPDDTGFGTVDYEYHISRTELTQRQWAVFLNAVDPAGRDVFRLGGHCLESSMCEGVRKNQTNPDGSKYSVDCCHAELPVHASWYSSLRFCNWLHNGQGNGDTETGAYDIPVDAPPFGDNLSFIPRNPEARAFIPNENEWYKAAYFDPSTAQYFDYPTASDTIPRCRPPSDEPNSASCGVTTGLTRVGQYVESASSFGTFDQCGNMPEWIEDEFSTGSGDVVFRGSSEDNGAGCHSDFRIALERRGTLGIRVAGSVP